MTIEIKDILNPSGITQPNFLDSLFRGKNDIRVVYFINTIVSLL